MIAIGIDIGGTSIKGAAVNDKGHVFEVFSMPVEKGEDQETTIIKLRNLVKDYISSHKFDEEIVGIGMGIPGAIDSPKGIVSYSNNLKWRDLNIREMMAPLGYEVRITNDANAAALGEARFGAGKDYRDILMITLGTGVGGGIIIDRKLYEGNEGKGAELGHMIVKMGGRQCSCGRKGCLEAYASATGLLTDARIAMEKDKETALWEMSKNGLNAKVVFDAAKAGDKVAIRLVRNYIKYLSEGLMNYFNIFRPEAVVLSGGIAKEGNYLISRVKRYCKRNHYGYEGAPEVEILVSKLGYDSGKIGAASLFFE